MLNINKTIGNGKAVFALEGRLDADTSPSLEAELKDVLDEVNELILDFGKLEYISSAGLRVLLDAHIEMSKHGGMTLTHVNETVMEIFDIMRFSDILNIE